MIYKEGEKRSIFKAKENILSNIIISDYQNKGDFTKWDDKTCVCEHISGTPGFIVACLTGILCKHISGVPGCLKFCSPAFCANVFLVHRDLS